MTLRGIKDKMASYYRRFFRRYFGYGYHQKHNQHREISQLTLSNLGLLESIREMLEDIGDNEY